MAGIPDTPAFTGASLTLQPVTVQSQFTPGIGVALFDDPLKLCASRPGEKASVTIHVQTAAADRQSEVLGLCYGIPKGLRGAIVLLHKHAIRGIECARTDGGWLKGVISITFAWTDQRMSASSVLQPAMGWHEYDNGNDSWGSADEGAGTPAPDGTNGVPLVNRRQLITFGDLPILTCKVEYIWSQNGGAGATATVAFETVDTTFWYHPLQAGTITVKSFRPSDDAPTSVSNVAAETGRGLPDGWGAEVPWANPGNAATLDASYATCTIDAEVGVSEFLTWTIRPGKLAGLLGGLDGSAAELRALLTMLLTGGSGQGTITSLAYVIVDEVLLCASDGRIVARGSECIVNDMLNFKIGVPLPQAFDREWPLALDLSATSMADLADINTNGGLWRVRFRVGNTDYGLNFSALVINVNSMRLVGSVTRKPLE